MGDSSGGGLAFGFAMMLRDEKISQPNQIILLSPWLDITMSNNDILEIDKKDKILGVKSLQMAGKLYADTLDLRNYRASPIFGDVSGIGATGYISVSINCHSYRLAPTKIAPQT